MVLNEGKPTEPEGLTIEAWAEGYRESIVEDVELTLTVVGSLIVMACVTVANMRRGVLLHKLILIELIFGTFMGTVIFTNPPTYHWYLSATAIPLNTSWSLHNVIAWIKNKPFLSRRASLFYIITVALAQPYWVVEIVANWLYFGGWSNMFVHTRPFEALFRDPWWVFTICSLFWNIKSRYEFGYLELILVSPRFGVLLGAMILSICFTILDILAVTRVISGSGLPDGINPFWKLSFVFKCLTDTIVLDDFKTALDRLKRYKLSQLGGTFSNNYSEDFADMARDSGKKSDQPAAAVTPGSHVERAKNQAANADGKLDMQSALRLDSLQYDDLPDLEKG
ncbi:hypothetical protein BDY17DRAFT_323629 [Neohortaea acidophila]|uniref:Uncharacterized protein n=1 Tax=Neohortaea acidophila TaxID=245834 RepID=A0A6A6PXN4_9PEZI|nr:uncharacterized protein BDY17DRAFT_323629 [Neohortaea acidophila]KAF2484802.1 hypothetical protein BDY17DRAFT_323629 [Neohortaea acidophila]